MPLAVVLIAMFPPIAALGLLIASYHWTDDDDNEGRAGSLFGMFIVVLMVACGFVLGYNV